MRELVPFTSLPGFPTRMRSELDRLFSELAPWREDEENGGAAMAWMPRMDVSEKENAYLVSMDLPGTKKEDVTISFKDHRLIVSGERKQEQKEEKENFYRVERAYGRFCRALTLPDEADVEHAEASFADGVLQIHILKTPESKPQQIPIK